MKSSSDKVKVRSNNSVPHFQSVFNSLDTTSGTCQKGDEEEKENDDDDGYGKVADDKSWRSTIMGRSLTRTQSAETLVRPPGPVNYIIVIIS